MFWGSNTIITKTWHSLTDKTIEVRYQENNETLVEASYISEITAAFTTANARIRLYTMLDWLDPSQVIYCDTDSVVFVVNKQNPKHRHPHNEQPLPDKIKFGG